MSGGLVIHRPTEFSAFEFVVLSGLRAAQLMRGCTPKIEPGHKTIVTAQMEIASYKVLQAARAILPVD
jgi:DNA-directed RNA polymerase subunit K/omega